MVELYFYLTKEHTLKKEKYKISFGNFSWKKYFRSSN